jgi:4-amino-4-deoxychorismate lyase
MPDDTLIDGSSTDGSWLDERALQFGDGLFETLAVVDARPCLWSLHMARLAEGCRRLRLPFPDLSRLAEEAGALCAGRARAVLKIYWTAGPSPRGYRRPSPLRPRRMLRVFDWPDAGGARPWVLRRCAHRLSQNSALAQIKHLNRLDQVIGRDEWDDPEVDEGVMLDQEGLVVGGTMSNLFIEQGGKLSTPLIERAGIAGVVRALALRLAEGLGVELVEGPIGPDQVEAADAVYLTNSLIGVARVARYEDRQYDLGRIEHPLIQEVRRRCHQSGPWDAHDA